MTYDFASNAEIDHTNEVALNKAIKHDAALYQADEALYGSLQAWRTPQNTEDLSDENFSSLSKALLGDERLEVFIVSDYLANLSPNEFANVANTLANDTLSQLISLAQHYDPLAIVAVDPLDACQPVIEPKPSSARPQSESFDWVDYIDSDHYQP
ncbi:MAG: hypothetical protein QE263_03845 [Vampirovibrionales bacterium]|nr:hypothetical protein [Vampirovibrionales bacterium]